MTRPKVRLVYDRDTRADGFSAPVTCRCEICQQDESPRGTIALAGLGVLIGTAIPFAWDASGMIGVLASMVGVQQ